MHTIALPADRRNHIKSTHDNELICNSAATEIAILDRWGKAIWQKARGQSLEPLTWNGLDCYGDEVTAGSYLCKIVYPDNLVVYVPFVFIQK